MGCWDEDREGKRCNEWHCGLNDDGYCTNKPKKIKTCKYWNVEHQDCCIDKNTYEQGRADAIDEIMQFVYKHKDLDYSTMIEILDEL